MTVNGDEDNSKLHKAIKAYFEQLS